jgi:putative MATE family efflux protein
MKDFTTGSVTKHLLQTASFMLVMMVFQTLYFLVDLYWVGRLGKEAVAAVGVAGNIMFISFAASQVLGVGTTTLISHAVGRRDQGHARLVFTQSLVLTTLSAVVFFIVAMSARHFYTDSLSASSETARLAGDYLAWFVPAMALQFGVVSMGAALRGTGNFKPGMIVQSLTVVLNIVLAPILIFGWGTGRPLGVGGAALATFISVIVGTIWLTLYFVPKAAYLKFVSQESKPRPALWGDLLKVGLPAGAEFALMSVYLFAIYALSRPFGAEAQAGFGIGMRVIQAGFMPVVALGFAVAPVAGQNFGARHADRVRDTMKSALQTVVGVMLVLALLCHIAPAAMIRVFSRDPHVVKVGEEYLRIVSWNFIPAGVVFVCSSMFQAVGNTIPSMIASGLRIFLAVVPAVWLSRRPGFQLHWMWYLAVGAVIAQMALSATLLRWTLKDRLAFAITGPVEPKSELQQEPSIAG